MAGRAKPPDWLEQASDPAPSSLKEPDVVVNTAASLSDHAPDSPVSQSASAISVTSPGPPTLLLRETLGRDAQRTSSSAAPPSSSSSSEALLFSSEEGSSNWRSRGDEEEEEEDEGEEEEAER